MVEDDVLWMNQQSADQINKAQTNAAVHSLITKERTQKLDLLIHLLSNLTQALVVCGPEGIGKTTLLNVLQERKTDSWRYCLMKGNADLSFEAIQDQLAQTHASKPVQSLSMTSRRYGSQHKQVVLIIDNAGELVPGLTTAIIQYAAANPVLRVIFALTHDELQMKRGSDRVVDDCHIVEIPPLSEKQCGDFLQYPSTKPYANLSFKAISEHMIAHIYRETHGVPGKIIAEISGLSGAKQGGKLKWVLVLAVATACAIAFGVQWLASSAHRYAAPGIALPPDLTSMDGGNAARLPGAFATMPSSKNNDKKVMAPASVEQKTDTSATLSADIRSQEKSALAPSVVEVPVNEAKDAIEPSVGVNTHRDDQQPVTPVAKPEVASTIVINPPENKSSDGVQQKTTDPLEIKQEKPKQSELSKTVNDVEPSIPENFEIKAQSEPISAVGVEQKPDNKPSNVAQQNIAGPLGASREKTKQPELEKTVNSIEPFTANNLEIIQVPQKPIKVGAVPEEQVIETAAPGQMELGRIGSLPIATLPPSLAVEGSLAQSTNNFTLQLIALPKQSSVNGMLKIYPAMKKPGFRTIKTVVNDQEMFILVYGSFPDTASADKARQFLPSEFSNAQVRKISSIKRSR